MNPGEVILYDAAHSHWLHFEHPIAVTQAHGLDEILPALRQIEKRLSQERLYAVGFISYEAAPAFDPAFRVRPADPDFPLLWFGLYPHAAPFDLDASPWSNYHVGAWTPSISRQQYDQAIASIKEAIARGETYQVNYTLRLHAPFSGEAWGLFRQMVQTQRARYAAYLDLGRFVVCSASPELFFTSEDGRLTCRPMKGTAGRGLLLEDDQTQADWLYHSEKNRAENVMIVDMIRNDLGRIAEIGSVQTTRLFEVERYPTVWQMTSTVEARSRSSLSEIMRALFPCASITGAPKVRTTHIIADLETTPRRIYTGCIGFISPQRRAQFNVAIRSVLLDRKSGVAEYGVGGGIVWDSTSVEEYEECQIKARLLTQPQPEFCLLESLLWTPQEGYFLLQEHLRRLSASAEYFGFLLQQQIIEQRLSEIAVTLPPLAHKVRLLLDRYGEATCQAAPLDQTTPQHGSTEPARLKLAEQPVPSRNIFLYHKTTHRQIYEQARATCGDCSDVLLWNERGELTESDTANLVVHLDGRLVTPPVSCGLLPGVFRQRLLERGELFERILRLEDLSRCEEIYLINSVRKWRRAILI